MLLALAAGLAAVAAAVDVRECAGKPPKAMMEKFGLETDEDNGVTFKQFPAMA